MDSPSSNKPLLESSFSFKNVMTLFAHESSSSLIETFPRSGSTVVLSNLLREKVLPQKQISEYKEKVLLVRSPLERLESFYLTKLVAGEPKSVVAIGELIYKRTLRYPILFYKSLKGFFDSESDHLLTLIAKKQNFEREVVEDLLNIKKLIKSLTFHDMMSLMMKYGMPRDAHVFPQFAMKTFRICEYNHIFNLKNFSTFKSWYESTTGSRFNLKFNHTQPNNRLRMEKFNGSPEMNVEELRSYKLNNMTPITGSLSSTASTKIILDIYYNDHDLEIIGNKILS